MDSSLGDRARVLHDLVDHPGWKELQKVFHEKKERYAATVASQALRGELFDQREIDRRAGYFQALDEILKQPAKAERRFEAALKERNT